MPTPFQTRIKAALLALFRDQMNDLLVAVGQEPLPASAFAPVVASAGITGDTIAIGYAGTARGTRARRPDERAGLVLTQQQRDNLVGLIVNIFMFAPTDEAAEARALACEEAIVAILDAEPNRYLGGLLDQPIVAGTSLAEGGEDEDRQSMFWNLQLPLSCHYRSNRPELTT
jgi:hypothetical protein